MRRFFVFAIAQCLFVCACGVTEKKSKYDDPETSAVECEVDEQCPAEYAGCVKDICVQCEDRSQCSEPKPGCQIGTDPDQERFGQCVECTQKYDCEEECKRDTTLESTLLLAQCQKDFTCKCL